MTRSFGARGDQPETGALDPFGGRANPHDELEGLAQRYRADGYLVKSPNPERFVQEVERCLALRKRKRKQRVTAWGSHTGEGMDDSYEGLAFEQRERQFGIRLSAVVELGRSSCGSTG